MTKKHTTNVVTREEYTRHTKTLVGGCFVKLEERLTRKERVNKRTEADVRWRKSVQIFPVCGFSSEPYSVARVCETALTPPPPSCLHAYIKWDLKRTSFTGFILSTGLGGT